MSLREFPPLEYCKTLIFCVSLFSRGNDSLWIRETLYSRFVIASYKIYTYEIIGEDFIFASLSSREFTRK